MTKGTIISLHDVSRITTKTCYALIAIVWLICPCCGRVAICHDEDCSHSPASSSDEQHCPPSDRGVPAVSGSTVSYPTRTAPCIRETTKEHACSVPWDACIEPCWTFPTSTFSLARSSHASFSATGERRHVGFVTPGFSAPESASQGVCLPSQDVYSFGMMLLMMLCRRDFMEAPMLCHSVRWMGVFRP